MKRLNYTFCRRVCPQVLVLAVVCLLSPNTGSAAEMVRVSREIDDDHIIIERANGEQVLLSKWSLRFNPLVFEGKRFAAEVSPLWVTLFFDDREPIKWEVEETLQEGVTVTSPRDSISQPPLTLPGEWQVCEETQIDGAIEGELANGSILKTVTGNIYQIVDYVYEYEYEYWPTVLVLQKGELYKLIIEGIEQTFLCRRLNNGQGAGAKARPLPATADAFESNIVSDFEGLDQGNIYELANGQIWEQTEAWIWIWLWMYPNVLIYQSGGEFKMKVEQIEHAVSVRRLK